MRSRFLGTLLLASVAACGGGGGSDPDAGPDSGPPPDAEEPHVCLTVADFGAPTLVDQVAPGVGDPTSPDAISYQGDLDAAEFPDVFQLELLMGYGVFTKGVTTGTFEILDDELNYGTCGLCPRIFADNGSDARQQYYATGGTITVTSINPNLTGTVTDLDLVEVTISTDGTYTSTPVTDGCATRIVSAAFDVAVTY
jgi:hypothetical protein